LARLDLGSADLGGRFGAGDLDGLQPFELLAFRAGFAKPCWRGPDFVDEGFELPTLGQDRGVDALVVLAALALYREGVDLAGIQGQLAAG